MAVSLLGLLHPDGVAAHARVVGGGLPARLLPGPDQGLEGRVDLLVLAPTRRECQTPGWLAAAVADVERQLAVDGVVYVLARPRWRARLGRLLVQHGLRLETPMVHFPAWAADRYLVPLAARPARYMLSEVLPNPRWKRWLALLTLRAQGGEALVGRVWPWVGFAARRPGDRCVLDWLFRLDGAAGERRGAAISASWRGTHGAAVVHRFSDQPEPSAVAKVSAGADRERAALTQLAPAAAAAGARVPQLLAAGCLGGQHPVVLESLVDGQSVASLLARRPDRFDAIVAQVADWLETWNRATCRLAPAAEALDRLLLGPAARLSPLLPDGPAYRAWLAARCAELVEPIPLVAAHNDLTTWNLLLDDSGRLGVVDWEAAQAESLPLTDFLYLVTAGHPDRLRAPFVRERLSRFQHALGLPDALLDLCLHACFIGHALDEQASARPGQPRPFRQGVEWLAANRHTVRAWVGG